MAVDPRGHDLKRYLEEDPGGPVVMLNLLRFAEGGRASYDEYARRIAPFLERVGGEIVFAGDGAAALVAEPGQAWDAVLLVRYPSRQAFLRMVADPAYQAITHLRTRALKEAVLQPTAPWPVDPELSPTAVIDSDDPRLRALAAEVTAGAADERDRLRRLFLHVRDRVRYSPCSRFHDLEAYRATATLERGFGYCVQKAVLLVALARAAGLRARLVFVDIRNHRAADRIKALMGTDVFAYHAFAEVRTGSDWVKLTPAFDAELCAEHGYPLPELGATGDAMFAPTDAQGRPFVEYVRYHGTVTDLPLARVLAGWDEVYGAERVAMWRSAIEAGMVPVGVRP